MNNRTMIYVVTAALSLGAGVFLFENKVSRRDSGAVEDARVFAGIDRAAVNRVVLNSGDRRVELEKKGDEWRMTAPVDDRTDRRQIAALLDAVVELREAARPIEARGGRVVSLSEYGLDKPAERVVVSYGSADAAREVTLNFGNAVEGGSTETGGRVYAALNDEAGRVLIVGDRLRSLCAAIGRDRNFYRSRDLFEPGLATRSVQLSVSARFGETGETYISAQLVRNREGPLRWELHGLDSGTQDELEGLLKAGRLEDPDTRVRDRADPARVEAFIALVNELKIESFVDDEIAAKVQLPGLVDMAEEDAAKRFIRYSLDDRNIRVRISMIDPRQATAVQVAPGRFRLIPTAQIGISRREVEGRPDLVYATRYFTRIQDGSVLVREQDLSVFAVRRDLLDKLPKSLRELRDPGVLPETVDEIKSLRLTRGGQSVELRREPPTSAREWTVGEAGLEADASAVNAVVNALRGAKAESFRDWPEARGEKIEDTRIELTATLKPDPSEKSDAKDKAGKGKPQEVRLSVLVGKFPEKPAEKPKEDPKLPDLKLKLDDKKDKDAKDAKDKDARDKVPDLKDKDAKDKDGKARDAKDKPAEKPTVAVLLAWAGPKGQVRETTVRLVEAEKLEALRKGRLEFYNRNYTLGQAADVVGFTLTRPDGVYELERKAEGGSDEWRVKSPYSARADNAVSNWPHNWGRLDESRLISKVVSDDPAEAGLYGLEKPIYKLTLRVKRPLTAEEKKEAEAKAAKDKAEKDKAGDEKTKADEKAKADKKDDKAEPRKDAAEDFKMEQKSLVIGRVAKPKPGDVGPRPVGPAPMPEAASPPAGVKPEDFNWYLKVDGQPLIYEVQLAAVQGLDVELHDTRLADFASEYQPTEIAISGPAGSYTLVREEKEAPGGTEAAATSTREEIFRIKIGQAMPENVHADRKADASALFGGFQSLGRDVLKVDKFLAHEVKDEALYARHKLSDEKACVKVTVTATALDAVTRKPVAGKPPVVREWLIGPEVELDGRKLRAVRSPAQTAIFTLKDADLARLTRPAADYLAPKPAEGVEKKDARKDEKKE